MNAWCKRLIVPSLVALVALALLAGPAAAGNKVIREEYSGFDDNIDICGLTVDVSFAGTFRATIKEWVIGPAEPPANEFWLGTINNHGSATHTNVANGKTVVETWRVNVQEASMVHVGDGYWEYTYAVNGIPVRLNGTPLKDRGRIVITDTLYLGDLTTDADDFFVSGLATFIAGPHPAYNSNAFCEAYVAAIG